MKSKKCKNKNVKKNTLKKGGSGVSAIFGNQEHRFKKNITKILKFINLDYYVGRLPGIMDDENYITNTTTIIVDQVKKMSEQYKINWYTTTMSELTNRVSVYILENIVMNYGYEIINKNDSTKNLHDKVKENFIIKIIEKNTKYHTVLEEYNKHTFDRNNRVDVLLEKLKNIVKNSIEAEILNIQNQKLLQKKKLNTNKLSPSSEGLHGQLSNDFENSVPKLHFSSEVSEDLDSEFDQFEVVELNKDKLEKDASSIFDKINAKNYNNKLDESCKSYVLNKLQQTVTDEYTKFQLQKKIKKYITHHKILHLEKQIKDTKKIVLQITEEIDKIKT